MKRLLIEMVIGMIVVVFGRYMVVSHQREVRQLRSELANAQQYVPIERDTVLIHDTLREVATSPVIMAELRDLRRQRLIDEETIRALGLRLKQLDAVQTTTVETKDTARAADVINSSLFSYDDGWSHLEFSLEDSTFYYNIRDSLATVVYHEYKHRFLWFRWGVKGYKVKIVNFNPHARVIYNRYVKPGK